MNSHRRSISINHLFKGFAFLFLMITIVACNGNRKELKAERLKNLGIQAYYNNNKEEALDHLTSSIKSNHSFFDAHYYKIKILLETDQIEKANKALDQYLNTEIHDLRESFNLSMEFFNRGYYKEAIQIFDLILELDPNYQNALINRSIAYYTIGDLPKSYNGFTYVIEYLRPNIEVYVSRGVLLLNLKEYDRAKSDFQNALYFDPKDSEVHYYLGLTELFLENTDQACDYIAKAIEWGYEKASELYSEYCLPKE